MTKPRVAGAQSPKRAISFQDTTYGYLTYGRPKSRNIAVLSPHPPCARLGVVKNILTQLSSNRSSMHSSTGIGADGGRLEVLEEAAEPLGAPDPDRPLSI